MASRDHYNREFLDACDPDLLRSAFGSLRPMAWRVGPLRRLWVTLFGKKYVDANEFGVQTCRIYRGVIYVVKYEPVRKWNEITFKRWPGGGQ